MNDQRPTTDQPKPWTAPRATPDPVTTAVPAKPAVTGSKPPRPDMGGGSTRPADPKAPAPIVAQPKT